MKIAFHGAAGEVTGSCCLVQTARARVIVDFGLHQGGPSAERRNRRLPSVDFSRVDAAILTHAHLDHSGRLPLLPGAGFRGRIWATPATIQLTDLLLKDSAAIQALDCAQTSRRRERVCRRAALPLYTEREVGEVMRLMSPLGYDEPREIADGVTVRLTDAGHILGSASVEMRIREPGGEKVVVFSGDVGVPGSPLLHDPRPPAVEHADAVVLESTYGDRDHRPIDRTIHEFVDILASAREAGGKVLIPAFAVGRTQALIYHIGQLLRDGRVKPTDVYIDSPMAVAATELYRHHRNLFDEEAWAVIERGDSPLKFPTLRYVRTGEESRGLNRLGGGAVVIAASGMLTGGRVLHHLKHNLWKPETHLVFVGFQPAGSLGRRIIDGAQLVHVLNQPVAVRAKVHTLGGFSAHAGQTQLVGWASTFIHGRDSAPRFYLNHGEDRPRAALAAALHHAHPLTAATPAFSETVEV